MPRYEELLLPTKVIHQLKRLYPNHKSALCAQYTRGFRVAGGQIYENVYMTIVQMGVFAVFYQSERPLTLAYTVPGEYATMLRFVFMIVDRLNVGIANMAG